MTANLSDHLWAQITDVYGAILDHPFLTGLVDGSLDEQAFSFYVVQDAHYLADYARALAVCGARAPTDEDVAMFARHAAGAIEVERELHGTLLDELGLQPSIVETTPVGPTTQAYTSYLLATCHSGSFPEALGAVLPCYWIYWEVGRQLVAQGSPDPRYQRWIDTYGGEEFEAVVTAVLALTDRLEGTLGAAERERMTERFRTTSRYEWMFWDAAWRRESWPI